ncbi:39S ribosomal protein L46, mitochondrial [Clonorchis sinensis]|uniref:39S ribosomal protein L46, mitochondrial n=2 Tax=Clonorchis sinensis TaxID=79923 RepID=A0A8T1MLN0_CLOSI|nr:39S ribosomal protein L46, mitochondrial [Clonorchis sinensis]GAA51766.1 39S ribosomal protein L46 mitochondrial [Clonorchis sinensis]
MMSNRGRSLAGVKAWNLFSGLCIRRPTVVTPELNKLEQDTLNVLAAVEFEKSCLSAHEYRNQLEQARLTNALKRGHSLSSPSSSLLTAHEQELEWQLETKKFTPLDKVTDADRTKNLKTAWRQLDRPLFLLVKQSFGNETPSWSLPSLPLERNLNLREMAVKLAERHLPCESKCNIIGNAPVAVHVYRYRDKSSGSRFGVQMYFFNAFVDRTWHGEQIISIPGVTDFAWITQDDLGSFISDKRLLRVLRSFIHEY